MPLDKLVLVCDNCCCCNYTYAYVLQKKHMCEQMLIWARAKTCVSTKVIKWTDKIVELMNFVKIVIFRRALIGMKSRVLPLISFVKIIWKMLITNISSWAFSFVLLKAHTVVDHIYILKPTDLEPLTCIHTTQF